MESHKEIEKLNKSSKTKKWRCYVCRQVLGKPGGYARTGMCGPCAAGEADTIEEFGKTW
jgi:hypothetical protein